MAEQIVSTEFYTQLVNTTRSTVRVKSRTGFIVTLVLCCMMILCTSIGNLIVIISIMITKRLQTSSNTLIMNLALSDFLVAVIVMPLALVNELTDGIWVLGAFMCDFWTSTDVLLCTASILNFLAISIDRYLIIAHPFTYAPIRKLRLMVAMILCVWIISAVVSLGPVFGWGMPSKNLPLCVVNQSLSYQVFATLFAFYLPLILVLIIYFHIYRVAKQSVITERTSIQANSLFDENAYPTKVKDRNASKCSSLAKYLKLLGWHKISRIYSRKSMLNVQGNNCKIENNIEALSVHRVSTKMSNFRLRKTSAFMQTHPPNIKAVITLGVILGCFCFSWVPFFINALLKPIYKHIKGADIPSPVWLDPFLLWLGYVSSVLNPFIYSLFNTEFRKPFKEVLFCRCKGVNKRIRKEMYKEQFGTAQTSYV